MSVGFVLYHAHISPCWTNSSAIALSSASFSELGPPASPPHLSYPSLRSTVVQQPISQSKAVFCRLIHHRYCLSRRVDWCSRSTGVNIVGGLVYMARRIRRAIISGGLCRANRVIVDRHCCSGRTSTVHPIEIWASPVRIIPLPPTLIIPTRIGTVPFLNRIIASSLRS